MVYFEEYVITYYLMLIISLTLILRSQDLQDVGQQLGSLTRFSRSRHFLKSYISKTVHLTDKVIG